MSVVAERPLGRSGKVALVGLFITGTLLASAAFVWLHKGRA